MSIKKLNKKQRLMAKFMGIKKDEEYDAFLYRSDLPFIQGGDYREWATTKDVFHILRAKSGEKVSVPREHYILSVGHLKYHRSWDWLIPVIVRAEFVFKSKIGINSFTATPIDKAFELTYKLIKDFKNGK